MADQKTYAWGEIVTLGSLRVGSTRERLIQFYRMLGSRPGSVTIYTPEQIATVIGIKGTKRESAARKIQKVRSELVAKGILERVEDPSHLSQDDTPIYSWRTVDPELDAEAFEILNRKTSAWRQYIVQGERAYWNLRALMDEMPSVATFSYENDMAWHDAFPELVDFKNPDIINLWAKKVPRAIRSKKHPLASRLDHRGKWVGIEDEDIRLQVALLGIDKLIQDRLSGNPNWVETIESPVGWLLSTLGKVGSPKHPDCDPKVTASQVEQFLMEWQGWYLTDLANEALEDQTPERFKKTDEEGEESLDEGPEGFARDKIQGEPEKATNITAAPPDRDNHLNYEDSGEVDMDDIERALGEIMSQDD